MSQDANTPVNDTAAPDAENEAAAPSHAAMSEWEAKAAEFQAGWARERADFANYKRRVEKEVGASKTHGVQDAVAKFLPIIDDFELAMANVPAELEGNPWMNGVGLLLNKIHKMLDELHIEVIDPTGEPFDPSRHEAIGVDPEAEANGIASGHVSQTLRKGYASGERVLRSAMVRVAP
ncbi:MAG: nucleotide exchange factor GrpE [Anaerolineae bacterium]|nr:nucleotide exchange factor GrpE [Anaerolineae bacterium]